MKVIFVVNDKETAWIEYSHTGYMPPVGRRCVEIELTDEQVEKIGIRQLGVSCGKPVIESIESISLKLERSADDENQR